MSTAFAVQVRLIHPEPPNHFGRTANQPGPVMGQDLDEPISTASGGRADDSGILGSERSPIDGFRLRGPPCRISGTNPINLLVAMPGAFLARNVKGARRARSP